MALKRYEQLAGMLKRELDIAPDNATQALAADLRRAGTTDPVTPPRDETASAALILPDRPSIAVLPFANMSGDPQQEFFADGMVEDIITLYPVAVRSLSSLGIPASRTRAAQST